MPRQMSPAGAPEAAAKPNRSRPNTPKKGAGTEAAPAPIEVTPRPAKKQATPPAAKLPASRPAESSKPSTRGVGRSVSKPSASSVVERKPAARRSDAVSPDADAIRRRAWEIYNDRVQQGRPGSPQDDWLQAERELHSRHGKA